MVEGEVVDCIEGVFVVQREGLCRVDVAEVVFDLLGLCCLQLHADEGLSGFLQF